MGDGSRRIIPAYAGSTWKFCAVNISDGDHPRIRGEHWSQRDAFDRAKGSSPHTRGAPNPPEQHRRHPMDHPRIRGEHVVFSLDPHFRVGSSPHTRGARVTGVGGCLLVGIIPAYAGSTRRLSHPPGRRADHPRIRGEHVHIEAPRCPQMGSSPHTRGARMRRILSVCGIRIIPAYAGSTANLNRAVLQPPDHPRIRGEHDTNLVEASGTLGSSPHTRGALWLPSACGYARRIIPAYAGSTHTSKS